MRMDRQLQREITSLESERKMGELALKGHQNMIAEQLRGSMGQDMNDVLSGKKVVKLSFWQRMKNKFERFLWIFDLER